ncbi:MAG: 50S ribosomal protein L17 [Verrucomicrobia bacterium]|nr:50S ribosomal protein L17 [Verrucomicrobiota bacterium]
MRHGKKFNHLGRTKSHRKAMLSNMACSLIQHKRINTTLAKAKALRVYVEPLITKSKDDSTHSRRVVFSYLNDKFAVTELFREVAPKIGERPGGYTRIIKTGNRMGDNAEMCLIELVDFNELYTTEKKAPSKKRRRRRGGSTDGNAATQEQSATTEDNKATESSVKEEEPKAEVKVEKVEDKNEAPKAKKEESTPTAESKDKSTEEEKKD